MPAPMSPVPAPNHIWSQQIPLITPRDMVPNLSWPFSMYVTPGCLPKYGIKGLKSGMISLLSYPYLH